MSRTIALIAFTCLALGTASASAQSLTTHSPASDGATQGSTIDPSMRKSAGGLIDPNNRNAGSAATGLTSQGSNRMGIVMEDRKGGGPK